MSDKPILFSGPMVRAILREIKNPGSGKTQTRRVLDPQPCGSYSFLGYYAPGISAVFEDTSFECRDDISIRLPRIGDRFYVREAWRTQAKYDELRPSQVPMSALRSFEADHQLEPNDGCRGRYRHGRFMPRVFSRLTLEVTDVRVQRLQDISNEDAKAEGVEQVSFDGMTGWRDYQSNPAAMWPSPVSSFQSLWDSINGKPRGKDKPDISWSANPWVVAYTFKPFLFNIDQLELGGNNG